LTASTLALDGLEVLYRPCARALDWTLASLPEEARSRVSALVSRISQGTADYGLVPLSTLTAVARMESAGSDQAGSITLRVCPTDLRESEISAQALGRLSQALRDPVSKLALFANLLTHGPAERRSYYEATLAGEIQSLARLIDQLSRLACLMGPGQRPVGGLDLEELADCIGGELGSSARDSESPQVTTTATDRVVQVDGRLAGEAVQNIVTALPHADPACEQVHVHLTTEDEWLVINLDAPALRISSESLAERFEPFFEGTMDLGLILARTIIARHDGFITVKEGTTGGVMSLWLASDAGRMIDR
jgi:K+-sensing histidine kinase KdpD